MTTAHARPFKSTIGRITAAPAGARDPKAWESPVRRRALSRALTAILGWLRDPAGMGADLGVWTLGEEEVRADLEHGRD